MAFTIRAYHPSDLIALYRVCLQTGDSGSDASALYRDPELLGHVYVGPYALLEPDLAFVLAQDGVPCGYVLGARSSAAFAERCEREWFPVLRARYPLPAPDDLSMDAAMIRKIHSGHRVNPELEAYPAHLHIDLLPAAQGGGWGRQFIQTLFDRLRALGVPAVHLGVGARNRRAMGFYEHVGFHLIQKHPEWSAYGVKFR